MTKDEKHPDLDRDIEARLISQEHRLFHVLRNFFSLRPKLDKHDPRYDATMSALLWKLIAPGTAAITGASIVAIASVLVLVH